MAISRVKVWISAEVLTASDLNGEINNILNNAADLISPFTKNIAAGGFKITGLTTGAAHDDSIRMGQSPDVCEFRLTLSTGVPVTTADVTGAGTLFCAPYKGNRISLYDGSTGWVTYTSAEFSLALTLTSGKPYDIFCFANGSTPTLESLVWTNDTTRATALTTQNGVLVKSGAVTRRYMGTIYASGTDTTEDSLVKRYLWNYYNRVAKVMKAVEATDSWAYSTAAFRQSNNSTANQLNFVIGLSEDMVQAIASARMLSSTATFRLGQVGIGLDSTTVPTVNLADSIAANSAAQVCGKAFFQSSVAPGRHFLSWLEAGDGTDTQTWTGDGGTTTTQMGIIGHVRG